MRVGCEACHGAGSKHIAWARGNRKTQNKGLLTDVRKIWEPVGGRTAIPPDLNPAANRQLGVCASCHSRRAELQQRDVTASFDSNYSLALLREGLYYADGQILGEVYEAGSFLQSLMYKNGVSCSNCHDPHSNALRVRGNGLCLQCHAPPKYQSEAHFFHKPNSTGAQCVSCHMPAKTYMGIDRRRDHSFRIPDPAASIALGVPDACTGCHTDQTAEWANEVLTARFGSQALRYSHATAFANARNGNADAVSPLTQIANDVSRPAIVRATAVLESSRFPSPEQVTAALSALRSPEALMRRSAVEALSSVPPTQRLEYLRPLLGDPAKAVRMAVARHLVDVRDEQMPATDRSRFAKILREYEQSLLFNADMPESMSELGLFYMSRGDVPAAEHALLQARKLSPMFLPAMLNLADLYRAERRDDRAQAVLADALRAHPDSGDVQYATALLYVRTGRKAAATPFLRRAAALSPANPLYVYAYAMALAETGKRQEAKQVLEAALQRFPDYQPLRKALDSFR
jgi:predicted CXXCH cytochrome family protein